MTGATASSALPAARPSGVTVVICAHNAERRLPATLEHLQQQHGADDIAWEVLLVDNASTDTTAATARAAWASGQRVPLRIVHEPRLGQAHARIRGLHEARYDLVSFVDDDNWVCPDWIALVFAVMSAHDRVGACGGQSEPVYEVEPPPFFERFAGRLAVGPQGQEAGDVTETRGLLWGAGLTVRQAAWRALQEKGVMLRVTGRQGSELTSCDDSELCLAIRVLGWRLWYDPRLRLRHFLPRQRLSWGYLRRIERGSGRGTIGLDGYYVALRQGRWTLRNRLRWSWQWQAMRALQRLCRHPVKLILSRLWALEGDADVLTLEQWWGRCVALVHARSEYTKRLQAVLQGELAK